MTHPQTNSPQNAPRNKRKGISDSPLSSASRGPDPTPMGRLSSDFFPPAAPTGAFHRGEIYTLREISQKIKQNQSLRGSRLACPHPWWLDEVKTGLPGITSRIDESGELRFARHITSRKWVNKLDRIWDNMDCPPEILDSAFGEFRRHPQNEKLQDILRVWDERAPRPPAGRVPSSGKIWLSWLKSLRQCKPGHTAKRGRPPGSHRPPCAPPDGRRSGAHD